MLIQTNHTFLEVWTVKPAYTPTPNEISQAISQNTPISQASISQNFKASISQKQSISQANISKHANISSQYLKLPISQLASPISQLALKFTISQKANISTCLTNISACLKFRNISKTQYLSLPYEYLNLP